MFNPYEYAELELQDLYCEQCKEIISTQEYIDNDGLCDNCYNKNDFQIGNAKTADAHKDRNSSKVSGV